MCVLAVMYMLLVHENEYKLPNSCQYGVKWHFIYFHSAVGGGCGKYLNTQTCWNIGRCPSTCGSGSKK